MKNTLEDELLSNNLPYPQNFDGRLWNTIGANSRRNIPDYLQEEFPETKFYKIRTKFQEMNRFCPPEIGYFQKLIKPSKQTKRTLKNSRLQKKRNIEKELTEVRQQMQYALIMSNRSSNLLVDLMGKAAKLEKASISLNFNPEKTFQSKLLESKISRSCRIGCQTQGCFRNTQNLVFSFRKKQCIQKVRSRVGQISPSQQIKNRVSSIRLKTYSSEDNKRKR